MRLTRVGRYDLAVADDADGRAFVGLLEGSALRVLASADFTTLQWKKLMVNAVANPITALTRERQGVLRRDDIATLALEALEETAAVARAEGARLSRSEPRATLSSLASVPSELGTSMYFDVLAGRALEIDALTGAIVQVAERHGIAVPINRALLALLRALDASPMRRAH